MSEEPNERGPIAALVWMLIFLALLALGWMNVYFRLWF